MIKNSCTATASAFAGENSKCVANAQNECMWIVGHVSNWAHNTWINMMFIVSYCVVYTTNHVLNVNNASSLFPDSSRFEHRTRCTQSTEHIQIQSNWNRHIICQMTFLWCRNVYYAFNLALLVWEKPQRRKLSIVSTTHFAFVYFSLIFKSTKSPLSFVYNAICHNFFVNSVVGCITIDRDTYTYRNKSAIGFKNKQENQNHSVETLSERMIHTLWTVKCFILVQASCMQSCDRQYFILLYIHIWTIDQTCTWILVKLLLFDEYSKWKIPMKISF